eukprot:TRINITY_DN3372_c0_g4_i3.p1 TRINITY_DN3372_c0_g4~~TRINITY_DN3372_c0_g4_i3.p1  ORF type:complete len:158 (+),score=41.07 TRINITY_DN3372_c0_g4_i3:659-1132(+)
MKCRHCSQEFDSVALFEHIITTHFEVFDDPTKEKVAEEEMKEKTDEENYIICSVCNMRVHTSDLDAHIDTHNYESAGDTDYYIPARTEEDLTRMLYTGKGDERECAICAVEYKMADALIRLQCGHYQHEECALKWIAKQKVLQKTPTCPSCLYSIFN